MSEPQTLQTIREDMKEAMKAGRSEETSTLRMLMSSLNNEKIDKGDDLDDEDIIEVLDKEAKKRRESIDAYREGGRDDKADKEERELEVIQRYLPEPLSDEEVDAIIEEVIEETGADDRSDMGAVMGQVMPRVKGRYDGSKVQQKVLDRLG